MVLPYHEVCFWCCANGQINCRSSTYRLYVLQVYSINFMHAYRYHWEIMFEYNLQKWVYHSVSTKISVCVCLYAKRNRRYYKQLTNQVVSVPITMVWASRNQPTKRYHETPWISTSRTRTSQGIAAATVKEVVEGPSWSHDSIERFSCGEWLVMVIDGQVVDNDG